MTSSSRSISRWARSRSWRISRSPPSRTLRRTSLLAPSASSSARSASSFLARASMSESRFFSSVDFSALISASRRGQVAVPRVGVDARDQVRREVDDLLEVLGREVEQVAQPRRDALEVPDVGDRSGQLDVAHPLTAHLGAGHLDAAALADDALEAHPLVLAAVALPVPGGTEDLLAEQTVLLRLEGPVVDGLGLLHLAVAPLADVVGGGQTDAQLVEDIDVEQDSFFPSFRLAARSAILSRWWRPQPHPGIKIAGDQTSSTELGSKRRDRSMPSSSAARYTSSSVSRISTARRRWRAPRRSGTATAAP